MKIVESDFILEPISKDNHWMWDLTFMKRVKKQATGKYEIEPGNTLYGMPLERALLRIIYHRTAKKFGEENIRLFEFIKELDNSYKEIIALCKDSLPEKFDTND